MGGDFQVGPWRVEPNLNAVSRNGTTVHLEPKVMEVLVCLAEHPGQSVSKESLLQVVWPCTFVSDDVLKRSIHELRRVFEDDARDPTFIQTVAKRGYRLLAPVGPANGHGTVIVVTEVPQRLKLLVSAALLVALGVLSAAGLQNWMGKTKKVKAPAAHVEPQRQNISADVVKKRPTHLVPRAVEVKKQGRITGTRGNRSVLPSNVNVQNTFVSVETAPVRAETRVQNIPPEAVRTRVIHAVLPVYPEFAKQNHITGIVEIGLGITPRGDVGNARVLIGHPMLVTPALEAIRQWRFQPNLVQGEATSSRMRALVHFNADGTTAVAFAHPLLADSFGDPGARRDEVRESATPPIVPEAR